MSRHRAFLMGALVCAATANPRAFAVDLVRNGRPVAMIVLNAQPWPVESYAAEELRYHVKVSTGADLKIISEDAAVGSGTRIYLGRSKAALEAKVDPSGLPGNGYVVRTAGQNLYIAGKDSSGGVLHVDTHAGTLFAVYDLLENHLGVRWLWPGELGELIPRRKNLSLPALNASVKPLLWFKQWRGGLPGGRYGKYEPSEFAQQQARWMRRQRFGRGVQPVYGHSFTDYWGRFSKTHPEYFAMMPDGTRGPDPLNVAEGVVEVGRYMHMCVSEPGLWKQVIEDWKAAGSPEFLNICENDGYATCTCPRCLAWDEPDPELRGTDYWPYTAVLAPAPFDQRVEAARNLLEKKNGLWMLQLGSLSARYARFAGIVAEEARRLRPDVTVVSYAYDNYRKPPAKHVPLGPKVLLGFVPWAPFPYNSDVSKKFQTEWGEWAASGASLFLRPNYTLEGHNLPAFYARQLGADLKFAMAHSMSGADFDSLTGQFSTQGPTMYMLARILNKPEDSVDSVIDEYCAAFGPASASIKQYFDHWETVTQSNSMERVLSIKRSKNKYGRLGTVGLLEGPELFSAGDMSKGWAILERARKQAARNPVALARVEWLVKGLKHADLVLAAEKAYERSVDSGDRSGFEKAHRELSDFRARNAGSNISDFRALAVVENRIWKVNR